MHTIGTLRIRMGNANTKAASDSIIPVGSTSRRCFGSDDDGTDQYTLVWLDESSLKNSRESLRTRTLLCGTNAAECLFF